MTAVDDLWFLADEAGQQAERTYHRLLDRHDDYREFETTKRVSATVRKRPRETRLVVSNSR